LAGYATEEFVATEISKIPKLDLTPYATTKQLNEAILGITIPDVSDFATREEVEQAIAAIVIPEVNLSNYYTKVEIDDLLSSIPSSPIYDEIICEGGEI
jgi:hypothetical protein